MRRLVLILSAVLVLAACSDTPQVENAPVESTAAPQTSAAESTTTTVAAETTTTATPETTTTVAETTTTASEPLAFDTPAGTPPDEFQSFTGTMSISFELDEAALTVNSIGTWTEDAFECTMSSELGGLEFSESIVATPETLWYDQGNGYEEADLFTGSATDLMGSCPAAPLFWTDFTTEDAGNISGDATTFNGRTAYEADLTDLFGAFAGLGMAGIDADMVDAMQVWIDAETNTIIGLYAEITMPAEFLEGSGVEGDTQMVMEFELDNFDDPTLSIDLP